MREMVSTTLTEAEALVLNELSDDAEDLEQVYRQLAFELVHGRPRAGADQDSFLWRDSDRPLPLAEIAETLRSLVERGLIDVRFDPAEPQSGNDLSYIWRGWFVPTPEGRALLASHESPGP